MAGKKLSINELSLDKIDLVQVKKTDVLKTIEENSFLEVTNHTTYESAKKARTNLRTQRTSLEKEKKAVLNKIKESLINPVSDTYDEFINIVRPHEDKQQLEIDRYEELKEKEKQEKERINQERIDKHKSNIDLFYEHNKTKIEALTFDQIGSFEIKTSFPDEYDADLDFDADSFFEEFEAEYLTKKVLLTDLLSSKTESLKEAETARLKSIEIEEKSKINNWFESWFETAQNDAKTSEEYLSVFDNFLKPLDINWSNSDNQVYFSEKRKFLVNVFEQKLKQIKELEEEKLKLENEKNLVFNVRVKRLEKLGYTFNEDGVLKLISVNITYGKDYVKNIDVAGFEQLIDLCESDIKFNGLLNKIKSLGLQYNTSTDIAFFVGYSKSVKVSELMLLSDDEVKNTLDNIVANYNVFLKGVDSLNTLDETVNTSDEKTSSDVSQLELAANQTKAIADISSQFEEAKETIENVEGFYVSIFLINDLLSVFCELEAEGVNPDLLEKISALKEELNQIKSNK